MRPINIYALTRVSEAARIERLERQLSGRDKFIRVKEWETESLKRFCGHLGECLPASTSFRFYYSFVLPKLGKEFDLLRVNETSVINIELKSGEVSDDAIKKQLLQNRYYLAMLSRTMYFFTYVSSTDRLVRLSNGGRLIEASWEELCIALTKQEDCFTGEIEELFKENQYLISPLTDTGRFLRREYFLTFQQRDIKKRILRSISKFDKKDDIGADGCLVQGFTGLPGTGKTILLYDIAMELSEAANVCLFHFGAHAKELEQLNERLKRVDFYYCQNNGQFDMRKAYTAILVDEGHRIGEAALAVILRFAKEWRAPVIFSYDSEAPIAPEERKTQSTRRLEAIHGFVKYELTNRIRLNNELSAFIRRLMCIQGKNNRREFPNVSLAYAKDATEANLLRIAYTGDGYMYIRDALLAGNHTDAENTGSVAVSEATSREFEKVLMVVDATFYYDENGFLRSAKSGDGRVRHLYHGLNRAKNKIALIVIGNIDVFDRLLGILQHRYTNERN